MTDLLKLIANRSTKLAPDTRMSGGKMAALKGPTPTVDNGEATRQTQELREAARPVHRWTRSRMLSDSPTYETPTSAAEANRRGVSADSGPPASSLEACQGCAASMLPASGRWVDGVWSCPSCQDRETISEGDWVALTADDSDVPEQVRHDLRGASVYVADSDGVIVWTPSGGEGV